MSRFDSVRRWYQTYEKFPKTTGIISAIALGLLGGLAFFFRLGSIGLIDETEPMFADAARRMLLTGDWITPYYNGETRFDKPPLVYWLMAIAYKIVGVNAWGARLPSAFAALGLMILLFILLRKFGFGTIAAAADPTSPKSQRQLWLAAWIGSSLVALNLQTIVWARQGVADMLLNGCFSGGLICFFYGYGSGGKAINRWLPNSWYIAAYVLLACAVLAKGPVGIVVPGMVILVFLLYLGKFREVFKEAKPLMGTVIFLAIATPWFVLVTLRNGQAYIDSFFGYHNVERFTGVVNGHNAPWYFYFLVVLIGFLPWSVYLPGAIARLQLHRPSLWRQAPREAHLALFAGVWFWVVFIFFTIAVTKLPSYTIPLLPAAAILVALFSSYGIEIPQRLSKGFLGSAIANVVFGLILSGFMLYSPRVIGDDPAAPDLAATFAQSNLAWWGFGIWLVGSLMLIAMVQRRSPLGIYLSNSVIMVALITLVLLPVGALIDQERQSGLREIAHLITTDQRPNEAIAMVGFEKPSLVFYSGQDIHFINPDQEDGIAAINAIATEANPSFLLITGADTLGELPLADKTVETLLERKPYQLLRVERQ